ncbi:MAG: sigma-54-dependent Fis family transcriptional regulator [Spirochaetales bacterium]|nr:sigma-54-dependent Fis family transcriptional regulator [Spirochaetales bacterium]
MKDYTIAVIDDEPAILFTIEKSLSEYQVDTFSDAKTGLEKVLATPYDIIIIDYKMPGISGIEFLKTIKSHNISYFGIMITAYAEKDLLENLINDNLINKVFEKPLAVNQIREIIHEAVAELNQKYKLQADMDRLVTENKMLKAGGKIIGLEGGLKEVSEQVKAIATYPINVLITGETGTGKEVIADLLHHLWAKEKQTPFIKINCAAIPEHLLEGELFGYKKGAFTGAERDKPGKIELAHKGTLLLDEIGEMRQDLQAKLLRVLQEKKVENLGSNTVTDVDFNLICTTNRDLIKACRKKIFRPDLYYRISTFHIPLPALRDRKKDIPELINYFNEKHCKRLHMKKKIVPEKMYSLFSRYGWPGNIRELEHLILRMVIMTGAAPELNIEQIPFQEESFSEQPLNSPDSEGSYEQALQVIAGKVIHSGIPLKQVTKDILHAILKAFDNNVKKASEKTTISKDIFYRAKDP